MDGNTCIARCAGLAKGWVGEGEVPSLDPKRRRFEEFLFSAGVFSVKLSERTTNGRIERTAQLNFSLALYKV